MIAPSFTPGFRLSSLDILISVVSAALAITFAFIDPNLGLIIAFVVIHFFLFCNVFRVARPLELTWAGVFILLGSLAMTDVTHWSVSYALTFLVTIVIVMITLRRPSYHGIGWRRINPDLSAWWKAPFEG
ncbi:MAG: hypothetical protein WD768_06380 [Phycisphaeraceae bacterium]